ncbi:MAG TPA: hypothetical protein PKW14_02570 [Bacteroidota bacterium]|jgi:hypothetical protein|nr:hypothetical protein [Bacteroidota bacterium]
MPDLSIHVNKELFEKLKRVAKKEEISISRWVRGHLERILQEEYPSEYFDSFDNNTKILEKQNKK